MHTTAKFNLRFEYVVLVVLRLYVFVCHSPLGAISMQDSIAYLEIRAEAPINLTSMHFIIYREITSRYIDVIMDAKMTI